MFLLKRFPWDKVEEFERAVLPFVERPSRYLGGEVNSTRKVPGRVRTRVALAFPDLYEVGMSHQGLRILYHLLNTQPRVMAERAFTPWTDCAALLEARGYPLSSLESRQPLKDFDILGFSLLYELSFTNVLKMLSLAGIPLKAAERDESWPLVIAGGPCAMNPEPLAPFLDAVALGDGEALFPEVLATYESWREGGGGKDKLLDLLEEIPGLYIPSRFRVHYTTQGTIERIEHLREPGRRVSRRFLDELEGAPYPKRELVPFAEVIHDRLALEVQRGCTRGCRFCHAGMVYRPVRERSAERVRDLLLENLKATGYEEVALCSLSLSDWAPLRTFVPELMEELANTCTSLSLPSLRVGVLEPELVSSLARVRRTAFTLAPEAGTDRLRKVINKEWKEEELLEDVRRVLSAGWEKLKLYFMVGLPTEGEEDIQAIIRLSRRLLTLREGGRCIKALRLSFSPFVPKAHTPFQWCPQEELPSLKEKLRRLKASLRGRSLKLSWSLPEQSFLEASLSRGDRRLARVVESAFRRGAWLDSWSEKFNLKTWLEAFEEEGLDPTFYANRQIPFEEVLPWEHLESGVSKAFLEAECRRGLAGLLTQDCREVGCGGCGLEGRCPPPLKLPDGKTPRRGPSYLPQTPRRRTFRFGFAKVGRMRFLSHLELYRVFCRAFRRAGIPLSHSQGYHPHPRIAFGYALPVGVESRNEVFHAQLLGDGFSPHPEALKDALQRELPEGIEVLSVMPLPDRSPPPAEGVESMSWEVWLPRELALAKGLEDGEELLARLEGAIQRKPLLRRRRKGGGEKLLNVQEELKSLAYLGPSEDPDGVPAHRFSLRIGCKDGAFPKPSELMALALELEPRDLPWLRIIKTDTTGHGP